MKKGFLRKMFAMVLTAAMITPSLLPSAVIVKAEQTEKESQVLYVPDMNSMDEFTTYTGSKPGNWTAENGTIRVDNGQGNKAVSERADFTDFIYEADITINGQATNTTEKTSMQGGVVFRVTGAVNGIDGYNGYYFGIDAVGDVATLGRVAVSGTAWTELATKRVNIEEGRTYRITVAAYGGHITCSVDDAASSDDDNNYAKIDVVENTYSTGAIGVRNFLSDVSFQNLKVSEYTETPLAEEDSYVNGQWREEVSSAADPDILFYNGTYYLYPTTDGNANQGIKVYTSTDLVHWKDRGWAFRKGDGYGTSGFWAPDLYERDGIFYMYYVANEQICVATSDSPLGPFTQDESVPMDTATATYTDSREIDPHVFYDEASGKYYFYCVRFTNGNAIWGAELNDDMKTINKDTLTLIVEPDQGWDQNMGNVNEGPFMLVKDGKYYMTYSGSHFQSIKYGSGYAVGDSPLGPFTKYEYNPIMQSNQLVHGAGHHCVTESPDGQEMFIVYHTHYDVSTVSPRQLGIDRMRFTTDAEGNTVLEVKGPTLTAQALPSGAKDVDNFIEFEDCEYLIPSDMTKEELDSLLPDTIIMYTSKTEYEIPVTWDISGYEGEREEEYVFEGSIEVPEGVVGDYYQNAVMIPTATVGFRDGKLQAAVDASSELDSKDYTPASWAVYAENLQKAKEVNNRLNVTQEEMDAALASLDVLVEKEQSGYAGMGLAASYDMTVSDGMLIDSTVNGHHAEIVSSTLEAVSVGEADNIWILGGDDYAKLPEDILTGEKFIVEATVKTDTRANAFLWCFGTTIGNPGGDSIFMAPKAGISANGVDDPVRVGMQLGGQGKEKLVNGGAAGRIEYGTYSTIRVEFDNGSIKVYVDGALTGENANTGYKVQDILSQAKTNTPGVSGYIGQSVWSPDPLFKGTLTQLDIYVEKELDEEIDKTALEAAVAAEKEAALSAEDYTEATWKVYADALAKAEALLDDAKATQSEVDAAAEALAAAAEQLRFRIPYEDVTETDWFYESVYYNYFAKTMTGLDETHFGPYGELSRAQLALILYRIEGTPDVETEKTFKDISGEEWYGQAVLWAAEAGIVTGYLDGNFGPADNITREQMALMMYRYAKYLEKDVSKTVDLSGFSDAASVSEFAETAMSWANGMGIITGKEEGTKLDPQGNTARCEAAAIIERFMK